RWQLEPRGGGWRLVLDLDDGKLPLPYVIDPAISYGPGTNGSYSSTSTVAVTNPGVDADDFLLAQIVTNGGSTTATPPAGWTLLDSGSAGSGGSRNTQLVYYHVAGASEPASWSWSLNGSSTGVWQIVDYSG